MKLMHKRILNWYLSRECVPYWYVLAADCLIVLASGLMAYAIGHGAAYMVVNFGTLLQSLLLYLLCFVVGFRALRTYSGIIRDTSMADLIRVTAALAIGVVLVMGMRVVMHTDDWLMPLRLRDLLLLTLIAALGMCGLRVVAKEMYDIYLRNYSGGGAYGLNSNDLLDMELNELLPRHPIHVDISAISDAMKDRSLMVTGAAGSIGSELSRMLAGYHPSELVLIDQAETPLHDLCLHMQREHPEVKCHCIVTSVCHSNRMDDVMRRYKPEIIFHAAAYKHVPMMEDNPEESVLNNVDGTCKLARLAVKHGVRKFIMISTDKAVNPTSVMGCSKRICEIFCQSLNNTPEAAGTQFITTRFGNVLGSNGSVIPIFREQIRRGGPVCVTHPDIIRYFMLIPEACRLVLQAAIIGRGGEIFCFDMGEPVRIADLATRMIELSGKHNIKIEFTGLRPGEKLYEELLTDDETVLPTRHPKIKIAKVRNIDFESARREIDNLIAAARTYNTDATLRLMHRIVPEYRHPDTDACALKQQKEAAPIGPMPGLAFHHIANK
ncbi:MAG: polysaccharide biosynthesis protein [Muribaculaceae bacterium]|nr:polysaccharide biosynthesis protein [Muribaculaceae bacterium]